MKRKAEDEEEGAAAAVDLDDGEADAPAKPAKVWDPKDLVDSRRCRSLKKGNPGSGPIVYWMSRDQRVRDNWALLHACEEAARNGSSVVVAFNLVPAFLNAGARQFGFMLRGLRQIEPKLKAVGIPFFLLQGMPEDTIPDLTAKLNAGLLVTDYTPLRIGRQWREAVAGKISCPFHEVDAHNVVPVWEASPKLEYGARTIRPKIHAKLPQFAKDFPPVPTCTSYGGPEPPAVDWDALLTRVTAEGAAVPEVGWLTPGEDAAMEALCGSGPDAFLTSRLKNYEKRNDPNETRALSGLSPWIHFGHLSAQRVVLESKKFKKQHSAAIDSFLEELVVRRELSDNFCHYNEKYDQLEGTNAWALESLNLHRADKREFLYTRRATVNWEQFERGRTHDRLWNAAQLEMVHLGKMHGFMRMYWAKKILEWAPSPEEALETAIYLNDRYELDGRDPNGYVGCMWSIAGIHDQGWGERPVFGKIRFMNYAGCKRKFDVEAYIQRILHEVKKVKNAQAAKAGAGGGKEAAAALDEELKGLTDGAPPAGAAKGGKGKAAAGPKKQKTIDAALKGAEKK